MAGRGVGLSRVLRAIKVRQGTQVTLVLEGKAAMNKKVGGIFSRENKARTRGEATAGLSRRCSPSLRRRARALALSHARASQAAAKRAAESEEEKRERLRAEVQEERGAAAKGWFGIF